MKENNNLLRVIGITICVIILFIVFLTIVRKKILEDIDEKLDSEISEQVEEKTNNGFSKVSDIIIFYTISDCVQTFFNNISVNIQESEDNAQSLAIGKQSKLVENLRRQKAFNQLTKEYKENEDIAKENFPYSLENNVTFYATNMYVRYEDRIQIFIVTGIIEDSINTKLRDIQLIVKLDSYNSTFGIESISLGIEELDIEEAKALKYKTEIIEENEDNVYEFIEITEEDIATKYFQFYKEMCLNYVEKAYELLDQDYREKRFGNIEEYKKYIEENRKEIENFNIKTNSVEEESNNVVNYVCKDQYKNLYIFKQESIMNFTVILDTYTLNNDEFIQTYKEASDEQKVQMNIEKWVQMLNNRDYKSAYNVLNELFRNKYFNDMEDFKKDLELEGMFSYYELEYGEFSKNKESFLQNVTFIDIKTRKKIHKDLIVNLEGQIGFDISYK